MEKLLLLKDADNAVYTSFDSIMKRKPLGSVQKRTFNSILRDLKRGDTWIQAELTGVLPYLACGEGWQTLSKEMMKRLFDNVPLKRTDHIRGTISEDGILRCKVTKWTWRYDETK